MQAIGFLVYMAIGVLQLFAIAAGLESWWGVNTFFSFFFAFFFAYLPLIGSIVGFAGAMNAWGWEWWQAGGLFFGGLIITFVMVGGASIIDRIYNI